MARRYLRLVDAVGARRDTHQAARSLTRHADVRAQVALGVIALGHARLAHVGRDVAARIARPNAVGFAVRADLERHVVQRLARRAGRGITDLVQRELGDRVGDGPGVNVARDPIDRSVIPIRGDKAVGARSGLEHAIPVGHARLIGFGQVAEGERPMGVVGLAPHDLRGRAVRLGGGDPTHTVRRTLQAQAHRRLRIGKGGRETRTGVVPRLGAAHLDGIERVGEEGAGRRARARGGGYGHQAYRTSRDRLRGICDLHTRRTVGARHALHHAIGIRMSRGIARRQVRKRRGRALANPLQDHRTELCVKGAVFVQRRGVRHVAAAVRGDPVPAGAAVGAALQGVTHRPGIARSRGAGARVPSVLLIVPCFGEREAYRRERVRHGRGVDGLGAIRAALGVQGRVVRVVARIAIAAVRIGIVQRNHGGCCAVFVVDQVLLHHAVLHLIGRIAAQNRAGQVLPGLARPVFTALVGLKEADGRSSARQNVARERLAIAHIERRLRPSAGGAVAQEATSLGPGAARSGKARLQLVVEGRALCPAHVVIALPYLLGRDLDRKAVGDVGELGTVRRRGLAAVFNDVVIGARKGALVLGHRVGPLFAVGGPHLDIRDRVGPVIGVGRGPLQVIRSSGIRRLQLNHAVGERCIGGAVGVCAHERYLYARRARACDVLLIEPDLGTAHSDALGRVAVLERHIGRLIVGNRRRRGRGADCRAVRTLGYTYARKIGRALATCHRIIGSCVLVAVVIRCGVAERHRGLVTIDARLHHVVNPVVAVGRVLFHIGERERAFAVRHIGRLQGLLRRARRCALGAVAFHVIAIEREGGVGQRVVRFDLAVDLLDRELAGLGPIRVGEGISARAHGRHIDVVGVTRLGGIPAVEPIDLKATGLIDQAIDHLDGAVLVATAVLVVLGKLGRTGLPRGVAIRIDTVLAVVGKSELVAVGRHEREVVRVGHDGLAIGHIATANVGEVIRAHAVAQLARILDERGARPRRGASRQTTLQVNGDMGQVGSGKVVGQVLPQLDAVGRHLGTDAEVERAVLAHRGTRRHLARIGHMRALGIALVVLIPDLVALLVGRSIGVECGGDPRVRVVEALEHRRAHVEARHGVVEDLLAVPVVLGQALDRRLLVGDAGRCLGRRRAPAIVLVAGHHVVAKHHGLAVHIGLEAAVGVVVVDGLVDREEQVGALAELALNVIVVPTRAERDVLGSRARIGEGVVERVLKVPLRIKALARIGVGTRVVAGVGHTLGNRVIDDAAVPVVLGKRHHRIARVVGCDIDPDAQRQAVGRNRGRIRREGRKLPHRVILGVVGVERELIAARHLRVDAAVLVSLKRNVASGRRADGEIRHGARARFVAGVLPFLVDLEPDLAEPAVVDLKGVERRVVAVGHLVAEPLRSAARVREHALVVRVLAVRLAPVAQHIAVSIGVLQGLIARDDRGGLGARLAVAQLADIEVL